MQQLTITTNKKQQIIDITKQVQDIVSNSNINEGICYIYTPHATAAIIINENWDPNIQKDTLNLLDQLIPEGKWLHDSVDQNGSAHLKSSILGPSEFVPFKEKKLLLGRWQSIMLCDFDGPRERYVIVELK
ncbi:MAG: secondary thiamine-phosphate synthase enzyme YjbQ [Candidatus Woesearchaeota archaeon]